VRGCLAVERGPIVYCAESATEELVEVDPASPLVEHDEGGPIELEVPATTVRPQQRGWPYGVVEDEPGENLNLRLVPYHRWGNRGPVTMRVWLPARRA
jgi:DUF1680 family protein